METAKETKRIGFVCFVAAFIGTFLTLAAAVQFGLGWWLAPLGALVFGTAAYLGYNWREVGRAFAYAWRQTVRWRPVKGWRENLLYLTYCFWGPEASVLSAFAIILLGATVGTQKTVPSGATGAAFVIAVIAGADLFSFLLTAVMIMTVQLPLHSERELAQAKRLMIRWNPIVAPCLLFYYLVRGVVWAASRVPVALWKTAATFIRFLWQVFCYLHCEERRICFSGTAIGVLAGFTAGWQSGVVFLGSVIGGAVGCLVGILEYELVARRWLKLLPVAERS